MDAFKKLIPLFILFSSLSHASASWVIAASYAGFLGDYSIAGGYHLDHRHSFHLGLGQYNVINNKYIQANLSYIYTPWSFDTRIHEKADLAWDILDLGFHAIRSFDNSRNFRTSPSKYPTKDYYDETILRFGLQVGTSVRILHEKIKISYFSMILDNGLIALYNNNHERSLISYYISHGIMISYFLD